MADVTWQPVTVQLSALVPWDRNPKTISKTHAKRMLDLWQRLGQFQTIAIGPAGEVYDGHQRLSVLKAAHGPRFEVTALQSDRALTEKEREELTVAAHVGTTGQFDWDELSGWDTTDLQIWGFDTELLQDWNTGAAALATMLESAQDAPPDDPGPQIDRAEELREKWQTATGQMWQLGEHRLICGDCTDAAVVARVMGGDVVGAILADPPYGMRLDADFSGMVNRLDFAREKGVKSGKKYQDVIGDDQDFDARQVLSTIDNAEEQFWFGADYYVSTLPDAEHSGAWLVWDKRLDESADKMFGSCFELIWSKRKCRREILRHKWVGIFGIEREPQRGRQHPNQKPVVLFEDLIGRATGDIYDPFLGSGTTLIACERLNRRCRGVEISPAYVAVTLQRWADMTGGEPVLVTDEHPRAS